MGREKPVSLSTLALRTCAVLAILGRTMAGDRVFDSVLAPLDQIIGADEDAAAVPIVTVSVDESFGKPNGGKELLTADTTATLVVELLFARRDGDEFSFPRTEPALEWGVEILARQVFRALATAPVWSDLFSRFYLRVVEVRALRGGSNDGERFAARQYQIDLEPIGDPRFGEVPTVDEDGDRLPWADFLDALSAITDPKLAGFVGLADLLATEIAGPTGLGGWQKVRAELGLSDAGTAVLGVTPASLVATDTTAAEALTVSIFGDAVDEARADEITGDEVVLDYFTGQEEAEPE